MENIGLSSVCFQLLFVSSMMLGMSLYTQLDYRKYRPIFSMFSAPVCFPDARYVITQLDYGKDRPIFFMFSAPVCFPRDARYVITQL